MELISRPHPKWSIARVQEILYRDMGNIDAMKELIQLTQLGQYLRDVFRKRLLDGPEDQDSRLKGKANDLVWRPYKLVSLPFAIIFLLLKVLRINIIQGRL